LFRAFASARTCLPTRCLALGVHVAISILKLNYILCTSSGFADFIRFVRNPAERLYLCSNRLSCLSVRMATREPLKGLS
jgi:hypothetical protein